MIGKKVSKSLKIDDILNKRFGSLTVFEYSHGDGAHSYWKYKCDCGVKKITTRNAIMRGLVKSCGCQKIKKLIERITKHNRSRTKIYHVWWQMINRCRNPKNINYKNYGGRGIFVSKEWLSFEKFYEDMGKHRPKGLWIDRIDNNGPYSKENCRWATHKEQQKNKKQTRFITFNGQTKCAKDWFDQFGISKSKGYYRLNKGWPIEDVLCK